MGRLRSRPPLVPLRRESVRVEGRTVRFLEAGWGRPVLFIHGLTGSTDWWGPVLPALARSYRLILLDLPGFGATWWRSARLYLRRAPEWLEGFVEAAGLRRFAVVGHSMGGVIALQFAARYPERVERLALVAPAVEPRRSRIAYALPLVRAGLQVRPRFGRYLLRDALRAGPWTTYRMAGEIIAATLPENLEQVRVPTLLIWGDRDPLVPATLGEFLQAKLPAATLTVLRGAGHVPMFDAPDEFNRALRDFLEGHHERG